MIVEVSIITWVLGGLFSLIFALVGIVVTREVRGVKTEMGLIREVLVTRVDSVQNELTDHKNDERAHRK